MRQDAGILFGVATYGNRENNVTLGCGYAYYNDKFLKTPVIVLGGMLRSSRRTALVTENWFARIPNEYDEEEYGANLPESSSILLISYGIRFMGERMSIDFAFVQAIEDSSLDDLIFPGIPYLDFVIKF